MSYTQKTDRLLMKQSNQRMVLQIIQGSGPISRRDIAQQTGLSPAAVSGITASLIESGLVQEVGATEESGRAGRRAILLRLNPQAGFVVGVKLAMHSIDCVVTDLDATVLHSTSAPLAFSAAPDDIRARYAPDEMTRMTIAAVEQILAAAAIPPEQILGIGIGVNGIVDAAQGICRSAPHFGWREVALAAPIAARFGIPVSLENDSRTLAIAEQWFGAGRGVDHFVGISVGYGIGSGIVSNGRVYRGAHGGAGEFGHMALLPGGPLCTCGKRGCLEALAGERGILAAVAGALAHGEPSALAQAQPPTLDAVAAAADAGDALARRVLAEAGRWLGVGIANLINMLNPQRLVINGEVVRCGDWYFGPMRQSILASAFDGLADDLDIQIAPSGDIVWARGAACVVLSELFTAPIPRDN